MNIIKRIKVAAGEGSGLHVNKILAIKELRTAICEDFRGSYNALKPFVRDDEYEIRDGNAVLNLAACKRVVETIICTESHEYYKLLWCASKLPKEKRVELTEIISSM